MAAPLPQIFIGLGSNLGDGRRQLLAAWNLLAEVPGVSLVRLSRPYRSAPVGMVSGNWFTNAAGEIRAEMPPLDLLRRLLAIEAVMGRRRRHPEKTGYQDRSLDLDLLYYGELTLATPDLYLPHPRRQERLFVLEPLAEIAGDFIDGETGRSISALLAELRENQRALPERHRQRLHAETWPETDQRFSPGDP